MYYSFAISRLAINFVNFSCFKNQIIKGQTHHLNKLEFYSRHFDIVSNYNVGLKTLLLQGLSEPEFYGDLVYKFRIIG